MGILYRGEYEICRLSEIGEGGLGFFSDCTYNKGSQAVVTYSIEGFFVVTTAEIVSQNSRDGKYHHGVAFTNVSFEAKRRIRDFIASRTDTYLVND
ncbi:MAG: hypothetical protein COT74_08640 [Bdellovibrionales bacterium CG10_big_fil_rev_8_21_14_0_10_45_34]|nr:MAG: hypothetical protein COT74_08640 [Bdellovibrionales bacterium CG10_big_fil_rev_8_21_14_0_10_45_34]